QDSFEDIPETIDENVKKFIKGVYKLKDKLIILLDLEKILTIDE
ncbi:MAG: chemotaxis protein CheW, partial [Halobacteriovorax sp.]|nr:chemotaxis protein CheW [Halobacteriovorax sp.]